MNLNTIKLVYQRELRDQLRDRRTLFTVLVLPILIYPLLGLAMLHISQFSSAEPCRIWLIGSEHLPTEPPLVDEGRFCEGLLSEADRRITLVESLKETDRDIENELSRFLHSTDGQMSQALLNWVRQQMSLRRMDLAILVPEKVDDGKSSAGLHDIQIVQNSSNGTSVIAGQRAQTAIQKWTQNLVIKNLGSFNIDVGDLKPFNLAISDVADQATVSAVKWSKTLPLIIVIWALTGAFYPAIDLCAGEKERGTLETLLSSPAPRSDIIGGKLLTVMTFSIVTAILNLLSLGLSAGLMVGPATKSSLIGQQLGLTLPPIHVLPILLLSLIPISALFSALAFAIAAFARSSKEGQYYLMPLLMLTFPLLIIPMLPGIHLNMGTCLIPVTGLILLLHSTIEGNFSQAAIFFGPVFAVTLICCGLALKWSAHQFNDESILFRSAEQWSLAAWLKHWSSRRTESPTMTYAILCAVTILVAKFFCTFLAVTPTSWSAFWQETLLMLFLAVGLPAILFSVATCRQPSEGLLLRLPRAWTLVAAGLLAIFLHPAFALLTNFVVTLYPINASALEAESAVQNILSGSPGIWAMLLVLAVLPAICEELAFRGFILAGLRSSLGQVPAVLVASLFFGLAHSVLQQSIITFFVGLALGLVAARTGSIFPCITFHAVHNSLTLLFTRLEPAVIEQSIWLQRIFLVEDGVLLGYQPIAGVVSSLAALSIWLMFYRHNLEEMLWGRNARPPKPAPAVNS
jgi:sodium transport system permease protein